MNSALQGVRGNGAQLSGEMSGVGMLRVCSIMWTGAGPAQIQRPLLEVV
jgi:hypothetical protein